MKAVTELFRLASQYAQDSNHFSLSLHTNTPVTSITRNTNTEESDHYRYTLHTPRGDIKAKIILHATNAYASHLIPHLAPPDFSNVSNTNADENLTKASRTTAATGTPHKYILPTRGQVITPRSLVPSDVLSTSGWVANEDYEYWFPRPWTSDPKYEGTNPLIILGGCREIAKNFEMNECDDSVLDVEVGSALRKFLPSIFEKRYDDKEPEWEWVCIC